LSVGGRLLGDDLAQVLDVAPAVALGLVGERREALGRQGPPAKVEVGLELLVEAGHDSSP
jgi:hypothetical protein